MPKEAKYARNGAKAPTAEASKPIIWSCGFDSSDLSFAPALTVIERIKRNLAVGKEVKNDALVAKMTSLLAGSTEDQEHYAEDEGWLIKRPANPTPARSAFMNAIKTIGVDKIGPFLGSKEFAFDLEARIQLVTAVCDALETAQSGSAPVPDAVLARCPALLPLLPDRASRALLTSQGIILQLVRDFQHTEASVAWLQRCFERGACVEGGLDNARSYLLYAITRDMKGPLTKLLLKHGAHVLLPIAGVRTNAYDWGLDAEKVCTRWLEYVVREAGWVLVEVRERKEGGKWKKIAGGVKKSMKTIAKHVLEEEWAITLKRGKRVVEDM